MVIRRYGSNRRGSVLVMVLYMLLLLSVLSITATSMIQTHYLIMNNENRYQQVFYHADAAARHVLAELSAAVYESYDQILETYQYNPLTNPTLSLQEDHRRQMRSRMYYTLEGKLHQMGYLNSLQVLPGNFEDTDLEAKISIQVWSTSFTRYGIEVTARNRGISRRMEGQVQVNNISLLVDSLLFRYGTVLGEILKVTGRGRFRVTGNLFLPGGFEITDNAIMEIAGKLDTRGEGRIIHGGSLLITGETIGGHVVLEGGEESILDIRGDLYLSSPLTVSGPGNCAFIEGNLYNPFTGDPEDALSAENGGMIQITGEIHTAGENPDHDNEIRLMITQRRDWQYRNHINRTVAVPMQNAGLIPEGIRDKLSIPNPDKPLLLIRKSTRMLVLPSGDYHGIIYTEGPVFVPEDTAVAFNGLIIAEGGLIIEGDLSLYQNRTLVTRMLENSKPLGDFFKLTTDIPLFSITYLREVPPNLID